MKKTLLVIENDQTLDRAGYMKEFMKEYDGKIITMTNFARRDGMEIYKAVSQCTDIAVQTCFVNGSDNQFYDMVKLLSKINNPINIYIAYLGNGLYDFIVNNTTDRDLVMISHHNIYELKFDYLGDKHFKEIKLDFTTITNKVHKEKTKKRVHELYLQWYKDTAGRRTTGRKILVLGCTAYGKAFENLPIGREVDELSCDELCEKKPRGVWIMGNGEPIMLVNDHGFTEYKVVTKLSIEELLVEITKTAPIDLDSLKPLEIEGLLAVIKDKDESNMDKANFIREQTNIPKRTNRRNICKLLEDNLVD